jgi:hypothetical protein
MVWEPGRITYKVDGEDKAVFTDNVPVDFAHGGMNNTIGFLNNNPNTSITVRDVTYAPLGDEAPQTWSPPIEVPVVPAQPDDVWTPPAEQPPVAAAPGDDPWARWTDESGRVDWDAAAAHVTANYEATGIWYV